MQEIATWAKKNGTGKKKMRQMQEKRIYKQ